MKQQLNNQGLCMWRMLILLFCLVTQNAVYAYQDVLLEKENQWGGKTTETVFSENELAKDIVIFAEVGDFYQLGVQKIVEHYDIDDVLRKAEVFYHQDAKSDYQQVIDFFNSKGNRTKSEILFNKSYSKQKGINRKIQYLFNSGFHQDVIFYTDKQAKQQGYSKSILYKDFAGDIIKIERFSADGMLLVEPYYGE